MRPLDAFFFGRRRVEPCCDSSATLGGLSTSGCFMMAVVDASQQMVAKHKESVSSVF